MIDPTPLLDDGSAIAALAGRFYLPLLELAYATASATLGTGLAWDLNNPRVQDTLTGLATQVRGVAATTREDIRALIGQATAAGWGPTETAAALRAAGVTASAQRAALIAVSETARAYSVGSILAYADSGVVAGKQWLTTDAACPICAPLDGKIVGLDEEFAPGITEPGAHPACRCAVAPVLKGSS